MHSLHLFYFFLLYINKPIINIIINNKDTKIIIETFLFFLLLFSFFTVTFSDLLSLSPVIISLLPFSSSSFISRKSYSKTLSFSRLASLFTLLLLLLLLFILLLLSPLLILELFNFSIF